MVSGVYTLTSGRKREFDYEIALDAAMHVFWLKGYAGASFSDLIESMNINKPSIYQAVSNKEDLLIGIFTSIYSFTFGVINSA
jgi:AcrR family transcriptional regulator